MTLYSIEWTFNGEPLSTTVDETQVRTALRDMLGIKPITFNTFSEDTIKKLVKDLSPFIGSYYLQPFAELPSI